MQFSAILKHGRRRLGVTAIRGLGLRFDSDWYLNRYPDVRLSAIDPKTHYLLHGKRERRAPVPPRAFVDALAQFAHEGGTAAVPATVVRASLADAEAQGLDRGGEDGVWISVGNDPKFLIRRAFPEGFLRLRYVARYRKIRDAVADDAYAELFLDFGRGFSPLHRYAYRIRDGALAVDEIVPLDFDVRDLRFDPVNTACEIEVEDFLVESVGAETVAQRWSDYVERTGASPARLQSPLDLLAALRRMSAAVDPAPSYPSWVEATAPDDAAIRRLEAEAAAVSPRARFSIVMPTYRSDLRFLHKAIESVERQIYGDWELQIVDDGSGSPELERLLNEAAQRDARISVHLSPTRSGVAAASNIGVAAATGDFVTFLDHDDALAPQALLRFAQALAADPAADMIYSDEDKIDAQDRRHDPIFKPDWSPETLLGCMYTCHLSAYRLDLVRRLGGLRSEFDLAQDYDLALRASREARNIVHVPEVLYHWRTLPTSTASSAKAKPTAELAARRALQHHLAAAQLRGAVLPGPFPGSHRVKLELIGDPLVSIVIPTAARRIKPTKPRWYLLDVIQSIYSASTYKNLEVVVVDNGDIEPALAERLRPFALKYVTCPDKVFNYSNKVNLGVAAAGGEFIILLNDDMSIITPDWIEELVSWLQLPGVAGAGAKLLFPNRSVQHAGVLLLGQGPSHVYYGAGERDPGQIGGAVLVRNYSAVTAACLAVRRADYEGISGFDPAFRVNYNDIDFCLRLRERGRIVCTPFAQLFHYESVSRDDSPHEELAAFNRKWENVVGRDPYYNPNLSQFRPYQVAARDAPRGA